MSLLRCWPGSIRPRPGQLEVLDAVYRALKGYKFVVLDAPTGWGKTLTALAALKCAGLTPVLWLVRSLSTGERIAEEAARLGLRPFTAAGRNKTCVLDKLDDVVDRINFCRYYRFKCPYYRGLWEFQPPPGALSYAEMYDAASRAGACPYYAQDYYIGEADVVVQNYYRRRPPMYAAVVVDEAHNFVGPREYRMKVDALVDAVSKAMRYPLEERTRRGLERLLKYVLKNSGLLDTRLFLGEESVEELWRLYLDELFEGRRSGVGRLMVVLSGDVVFIEEDGAVVLAASRPLRWRPLLYMSGTLLGPLREHIKPDVYIRVPMHRRPSGYIASWLTTRYGEFEEHLGEYRRLLTTLKALGRVAVFGSGRVLSKLEDKADYREEELAEIPEDWRGLMFLKARGRFSEGIDLRADAVVLLGAPYLTPDVIRRLADTYRRLGFEKPHEMASDVPMMVATFQCIGRALREPGADPLIVLADYRFGRFSESLGEFISLEELGSLGQLRQIIRGRLRRPT